MLYHIVPSPMVGDTLFPATELQHRLPKVYTGAMGKYQRRPHIPENYIPQLDCYWSDVVFFSAVHPTLMRKVLIDCGLSNLRLTKSFLVDPAHLDLTKLIVYEYEEDIPATGRYVPFDSGRLAEYGRLSEAAKAYYRWAIAKGERVFPFHLVTHILYQGSVNISGVPVVEA